MSQSHHLIAGSQPPHFWTSPIRANQDSYSPVASIVPKTPNIVCHWYSNDQQVPLTPVTQTVSLSPVILSPLPRTPVHSVTTVSTQPSMIFDNLNEHFSAYLIKVDQIVPSTPESNVNKTIRKLNHCEPTVSSHHTSMLHERFNSCMGNPHETSMSLSNDAVTYPRQHSRKGLSVNKSRNNCEDSASVNQSLIKTWTSQSQERDAVGNELLSISEYSSKPLYESSGALMEMSELPPVDIDLPSHCRNTPSTRTLASTSYTFHSTWETSNVRFRTSQSRNCTPTGISHTHTREEVTRMRRPVSEINKAQCFQVENQDILCHDSLQMMLFDGDDIFG